MVYIFSKENQENDIVFTLLYTLKYTERGTIGLRKVLYKDSLT
jgi:hypothetical protein